MDKNRPLSVCMVSFTRSLDKLYFYKSNLNLMQSAWWISRAEREKTFSNAVFKTGRDLPDGFMLYSQGTVTTNTSNLWKDQM